MEMILTYKKLLFIETRSIQEPIASVPAKVWKSKSIKDIIDGKYSVDFLIDVIGVVDNVNKKPQTKNIVFDLKDFRTIYHEEGSRYNGSFQISHVDRLIYKTVAKCIFEIITIEVALINFEQHQFYILPPALVSTSSAVNVAYNIDCTGSVHTRPGDSESAGSQLEECGEPNTAEGLKFSQAEETCNEFQSQGPLRNFIRADPSYLKTLGQAHSGWIFGGIAELVDNSKDAKATKMDIFVDIIQLKKSRKDVPMLCLIDDGQGMNHDEVMKMVSFGHKQSDKVDTDHIGKFGVGFKTGAMRLGRDVLVLTQTTTSRSLAFLSQSLNEGKDNIEIPIVSYCRQGQRMEVDLSMQSEALAKYNLKAIKDFSPFNKYLIGEKAALFGTGTGTQIYIWNLDEWGSKYCLEWHDGLKGGSSFHQGDILIRSKRIRSRPGQISQKVPLDYSLRAYLEIIFLVPRMKISVQRSLVKSRPLSKLLTQTVIETGDILRRPVELIIGFSQLEWERANCGMFLYWHGRLIEAYKRVGGMIHSADVGRGVIGVVDVTNLMDDEDGRVWVHNNKQGFQDSEQYACLEQWLGRKADEYWDKNFDALELNIDNCVFKPDHEWVQCDKCRKWRILPTDFDSRNLPLQWFCFMEPFKGQCSDSEQKMAPGIVNVSTKRSGYDCLLKDSNDKKVEGVRKTSGTDEGSVGSHMKAEGSPGGTLLSDNGLTDFDVYIMETSSHRTGAGAW